MSQPLFSVEMKYIQFNSFNSERFYKQKQQL